MILLIKNGFVEIRKYFFQFLCCILLIFSGITIFTTLNLSGKAISDSFYYYSKATKLYNFNTPDNNTSSFDWNPSDPVIKQQCKNYVDFSNQQNSYECELNLINYYSSSSQFDYDWDIAQKVSTQIFLNNQVQQITVEPLENNMNYMIPYFQNANYMESNYLQDGNCIVNPDWAKLNNYHIGDMINPFNLQPLKITGFGVLPYYVNEQVSPFFNNGAMAYIVTNPFTFQNIAKTYQVNSKNINFRFNTDFHTVDQVNAKVSDLDNLLQSKLVTKNPKFHFFNFAYKSGLDFDNTNRRISIISTSLFLNAQIANIFLVILLSNAGIITFIVVRRRISDSQKQIGLLKSLGYTNFEIAAWFLPFSFVACLIGSILGSLTGFLLQSFINELYHMYYPLNIFDYSWQTFFFSLVIPIILISGTNLFFSVRLISKNTASLMRGATSDKVTFIFSLLRVWTSNLSFKFRFTFALFLKSIGKMTIVAVSTLISGFLALFSVSASSTVEVLSRNALATSHYNYMYKFDENYLLNNNYKMFQEKCINGEQRIPECLWAKGQAGNPDQYISPLDSTSLFKAIEDSINKGSFDLVALSGKYYLLTDDNKNYLKVTIIPFITNIINTTSNQQLRTELGVLLIYLSEVINSSKPYVTFGYLVQGQNDVSGLNFQDKIDPNQQNNLQTTSIISWYGDYKNLSKFMTYYTNSFQQALEQKISNYTPIAVSTFLAQQDSLKVGSTMELGNTKCEIVDIYDNRVMSEITMSPTNMYKYLLDEQKISIVTYNKLISESLSEQEHFSNTLLSNETMQEYPFNYLPINVSKVSNSTFLSWYFNLNQLKEFISGQINKLNIMITLLIIASAIISLIIILVIANVIINENKIIISIMKVLGYRTNQINRMFLGMYLPVMLAAFLLSIGFVNVLLNYLTNAISSNANVLVDFSLNIFDILISLSIIIILYALSVLSGYRLIKKIGFLKAIQAE
ncbi:MAG: FtsX-like permease family protein [Mycoplasma sp.]